MKSSVSGLTGVLEGAPRNSGAAALSGLLGR
jgi:hypothetical protein